MKKTLRQRPSLPVYRERKMISPKNRAVERSAKEGSGKTAFP
jgi:hypothetical protein